MQAGLVPTRDVIAIEDAKNPYANLTAVRTAAKGLARVPTLLRAFQSPEVRKPVEDSFWIAGAGVLNLRRAARAHRENVAGTAGDPA